MYQFSNSKLVIFFFFSHQVALPADEDYLPLKPRVGKAAKVCMLDNTVCIVLCLFSKNLKDKRFQVRFFYISQCI